MSRRDAFGRYQTSMALFSRDVIGMALYPYQTKWADYLIEVTRQRRNETIAIEMPRQSGKNETSAQVEVAILAQNGQRGGSIVKAAPTWKPQIVNSKLRFVGRAEAVSKKLPFVKFKPTAGYIYLCGQAMIQFLSADPDASVVGATASLLLEVDESQDVAIDKYDKDFSPMRASRGAAVVHYGTTWTDDTLLERTKGEIEAGKVKGRYFRILPDEVALSNPAYGDFVDSEVARLGREHPLIKTQFFLEPLPTAGRMLSEQQLRLMVSDHSYKEKRTSERWIVAGLDFAGADEDAGGISSLMTQSSRDSVSLTVGELELIEIAAGLQVPRVKVLGRWEWVNVRADALHTTPYRILWELWRADKVHCDGTGIGATSTTFLASAINSEGEEMQRVAPVIFDGGLTAHTRLAFNYLAAINGARFLDVAPAGDQDLMDVARAETPPSNVVAHGWWQRGHAKLEARLGKKVRAYVPEKEGHDDLLLSDMLMLDAAMALQGEIGAQRGNEVRVFSRRRR